MRILLAGFIAFVSLFSASRSFAAHIVHHRVEARLDPSSARLDARDEVTFQLPDEVDRGADIHLLLLRELELRDVVHSVPGAGWRVFPNADPRFFSAEPDSQERQVVRRAQEIVLSPPQGKGWPDSFHATFVFAGVVYDSLEAPVTPYARSFPMSDGLIDSLGAYLAGSTLWIPSELHDLFTFELTADLPEAWHSMSQGALADSTVAGGRRRETWRSPEPMQEIYLVAGAYGIEREDAGGIEILTYLYHPEPEITATYLEATRRALDRYSRLIGPYPFRKFALVENFWQTGFGMPSFTLLGDRVIRLPFIVDTSYPHEILHNWWGNGVFVDPRLGNWCEGLTTYGADYMAKEEKSAAEARDYRRAILTDYRNYVRANTDFALERFTGRTDPVTQNVGYGKGMMVFHMLRRNLGEQVFNNGLRRFYQENLFRPAGWRDLVAAFEDESAQNLQPFYDQWVARPGAPSLTLEDVHVSRRAPGHRTSFTVRQMAPFFSLEVPVVLRSAGAETTVVVPLTGAERTFSVDTSWEPVSLAVDPDFHSFRQVDRREIPATLSQTLGADSTLVVIGSGVSDDVRAAFRTLATSWADGAMKVRVVAESDVTPAEVRRHAAWILGEGPLEATLMTAVTPGMDGDARVESGSWELGGSAFPAEGHTLVLTTPSPDAADLAWTFVRSRDPGAIPSVGRKLPHYGKYSYLVFEGDRNVAKGTLDPSASPLEVRF